MKIRLPLLAVIAFLAGCVAPKVTVQPPVLPHDEYLALEILNPRAPYDTTGAFVTTIYLIRNISKDPLTLSGGPEYHYLKGAQEEGSKGPMTISGQSPNWLMYGFGAVRGLPLRPGQALAFVSETQFGKLNEYPLTVRFDRYDGGMSMQTAERTAGLKYYVRFDLGYEIQPINLIGEPQRPRVTKSVRLDSPIIPITPEVLVKK